MSRLFWKFLFFFMLAQLASTACAMSFWLRHGVHAPKPPAQVMVGGVLASLIVAALLAWYVAKPIRALRRALKAAAQGDLDVRIGDNVGRRRDGLADLGRDFDITAARLKLLMDGQRRLLHDVSHELRSPLARLQAAVGLIRQRPNNVDVDVAIDRVERESIRMDKLIDELLTLSRLEAGIANRQAERVNVAELVSEVVADAKFELGARSLGFNVRVESLLAAKVTGNAELLHRALENVVRNSARYTPSGGQVHIVGEYDALQREVRLMIADEGPGVRTADLAFIFEPFFRGEAAQRPVGHGLGLAITHRVIHSHGGRISASNRTSGGLAVEICLPA